MQGSVDTRSFVTGLVSAERTADRRCDNYGASCGSPIRDMPGAKQEPRRRCNDRQKVGDEAMAQAAATTKAEGRELIANRAEDAGAGRRRGEVSAAARRAPLSRGNAGHSKAARGARDSKAGLAANAIGAGRGREPREGPRVPSASFAGKGRFDRTRRESKSDGLETARRESRNGSMPGRPERLWPGGTNWLDRGSTAGFGWRCGTESATRGIGDGFGRRRGTGPGEETRAASAGREESHRRGNHERLWPETVLAGREEPVKRSRHHSSAEASNGGGTR